MGFMYVAAGLFNKTIADLLAPGVDLVFSSPAPHSALDSWTSALAFTGQIYGDFAGYTEIAIGVALLLGFVLPVNFAFPYISASPQDFWRRWHISLSTWLRDYLYISLGGNRGNNRLRNLFLTMLLGGVWHGASWTFVIWGGYHGLLLVITHAVSRFAKPTQRVTQALSRALGIVLTFYLVVIGWVFFRAPTLASAGRILRDMHHSAVASNVTHDSKVMLLLVVGAIPLCHLISALPRTSFFAKRGRLLLWPTAAILIVMSIFFGASGHAFIYFQF